MSITLSPEQLEARFAPLFAACPDGAAAALAQTLTRRDVATDDIILTTREDSDELLLVWEGRFGVWINGGTRQRVGSAGPGAWLGDVTFIEPGRPSADVIAETPATIYALSNKQLMTMIEVSPALAHGLLHAVNADLIQRVRTVDAALRGDEVITERSSWLAKLWARMTGASGGAA